MISPDLYLEEKIDNSLDAFRYLIKNYMWWRDSSFTIKKARELLEEDYKLLKRLKGDISSIKKDIRKLRKSKSYSRLKDVSKGLESIYFSLNFRYALEILLFELYEKTGHGNKICVEHFNPKKATFIRRYIC